MKMLRLLLAAALAIACLRNQAMASAPEPVVQLAAASAGEDTDKVTTIEQLFEDMKKSFRSDRAKGLHIRYQFHFKAPQAGDRWIIIKDGSYTMGKGVIDHADVSFSCTGTDWLELSNGTLGGFHAYITGRLHVTGSQSLARKLDDIFP